MDQALRWCHPPFKANKLQQVQNTPHDGLAWACAHLVALKGPLYRVTWFMFSRATNGES